MTTVLLIVHLFVTLALIGVVLIQRSEGGGLGIGSSQGMGSFMSGRGTANLLTRTTAVLATAFMLLSEEAARGGHVQGHMALELDGSNDKVARRDENSAALIPGTGIDCRLDRGCVERLPIAFGAVASDAVNPGAQVLTGRRRRALDLRRESRTGEHAGAQRQHHHVAPIEPIWVFAGHVVIPSVERS